MTIFKWISKPSDEILGSESEEINNVIFYVNSWKSI